MVKSVTLFLWFVLAIVLQFIILPAYLEDPFRPNLVLILVAYRSLRSSRSLVGGLCAYAAGLVCDTFSGIYFGLAGISMLLLYLLLTAVADQFYAESTKLLVLVVFFATLLDALLTLILISLFSVDPGVYASILKSMVPRAVTTAGVTLMITVSLPLVRRSFAGAR